MTAEKSTNVVEEKYKGQGRKSKGAESAQGEKCVREKINCEGRK